MPSHISKWKWCVLPSMAMVLLSLLPQINLWMVRGRDWNGAYVSAYIDEPFYSGYLNALINGRPRKNDPFGGKDSSPGVPLPESIYSIQFAPAYIISFMARIFGASASTMFIVLGGVAALLASLAVFWLLNSVTGDPLLAAAGTLFVLCLGGFAGSYGVFGTPVDIAVPDLPFLRRYQPAATFPLFFVFQSLVWHALTSQSKRMTRLAATVAGVTLATLVFSYLYLWTASAAWLACIGILWLYFRPLERWKTLTVLTTIGAFTLVALVPYVYMLSHRAATLDQQQVLISTHGPDLSHAHQILGALIVIALVIGALRRKIERSDSRVIFATSLSLLPFVVFNQQILTGKSMQTFHFETYVVNYSTTLGLLITLTLFWKSVSRRLLIWMAALSFSWGVVAVGLSSRSISVPMAIIDDQRTSVLLRLGELSTQDGTLADLHTKGHAATLVFSPSVTLIRLLPTWTSQGTLLDMTGGDCGSATREEQKKFFYMHLYYSRVEAGALRMALSGRPDRQRDELLSVRNVVFGQGRIFPQLSGQFEPVRPDEIEREVEAYQTYANAFSREEAVSRPLTYAVIPTDGSFSFTNLDQWYERDAGERVGAYTLYRLKLRN